MTYQPIPGSCTSDGNAKVPMNCIWLDTLYWTFEWNFNEANICDCIGSQCLKFPQLDSMFFLQIHKASDTSFTVQLHRIVLDDKPDDGFILHFMLSIVGLRSETNDEYLRSSDSFFSISCNFNPENMTGHYCWVIKCYCEMCEITNLENEASETQNDLIEDLKRRKAKVVHKLSTMGSLLKCPNLQNVFSGRQSYQYAKDKVEIIDRLVDFADEILFFFTSEAFNTDNPSGTNLDRILGYIYRKRFFPIRNREILVLYLLAYHYGLSFLQPLCRKFISKNCRDIKSIINAFAFCDVLCDDSSLMDELFQEFSRRKDEILSSRNWNTLASERYPIADSIIDTFLRKAKESRSSSACRTATEEMKNLFDMVEMLNALIESSPAYLEENREQEK